MGGGQTYMTCKMCLRRGKTWEGSDPVCYFDNPKGNWNCATVGAIRNLTFTGSMFSIGRSSLPSGVHNQRFDDTNYTTILVAPVRMGGTSEAFIPTGKWIGQCLYLEWYKSRGRTDILWILDGGVFPRVPTEEELLAIIRYYNSKGCYDQEDLSSLGWEGEGNGQD